MAKNIHGTHSDLIHCDNCGEDYSSTYKRCPFCGARPASTQASGRQSGGGSRIAQDTFRSRQAPPPEDDYVFDGQDVFDDPDDDTRGYSFFRGGKGGGRHLSADSLGISPTTIISFAVSGIIVLAAILIVIFVVIPRIRGGQTEMASNTPNPSIPGASQNQTISPSPLPTAPTGSQPLDPTGDPALDPSADPSPSSSVPASPDPVTSVPPSTGGLTLTYLGQARTQFTISDEWPSPIQLQVSGASGTVTWSSSNTAVATVSSNGLVTGVRSGQAYVTATDAAGKSQTCHVIVDISGTSAPSPSSAPATSNSPAPSQAPSSGTLTLSHDDFTMSAAYPTPITIRASGASGSVTWSSSNTGVATVDANGTVSMVGKGQCRITATDSAGNTATCIVRVS